jgi:hypothetical protein
MSDILYYNDDDNIIEAREKLIILLNNSKPKKVINNAKKYFNNPDIKIYLSNKKNKKYMLLSPDNKWVHFGQIDMQDFTYHNDLLRRENYLKRANGIKGKWRENPYSPNNLAINLLWN